MLDNNKYYISQYVQIPEYNIDNALIVGMEFFPNRDIYNTDGKLLYEDYLQELQYIDYTVVYADKNGIACRETYSEEYLEYINTY